MFSEFWRLDDLEGLTLDRAGFVMASASHSARRRWRREAGPRRLVDFWSRASGVVDPEVVDGLKQALTMRHAMLRQQRRYGTSKPAASSYPSPGNQPRREAHCRSASEPVARRSKRSSPLSSTPLRSSNRMKAPRVALCSTNSILVATASRLSTFRPGRISGDRWPGITRARRLRTLALECELGGGVPCHGTLACAASRRRKG